MATGCPMSGDGACPEPETRFSLSCAEPIPGCSVEPMVAGSLGALEVSSDAVEVLVWQGGLLRISADGIGGVEVQRFTRSLSAPEPPLSLLPSVAGTLHPVVRAFALHDGAAVVVLEQERDSGVLRLVSLRLGPDGHPVGPLRVLWEGLHAGSGTPVLEGGVDPSHQVLVLALGTADGDGGQRRFHLVRADLRGSHAPLVRELPLPPTAQTVPAGVALTREGSVLVAGIDRQGLAGTLWFDHLNADLEVVETLWTLEQEMAPRSTHLIPSADGSSAAFGWFMPSAGEGLLAGLHRLEGIGPDLEPTRIDIWMGSFFGPVDGGDVDQALAFDRGQLVQVSLELGPEGVGSGGLLGFLRMDAGNTAFNPWGLQAPLRIPAGDPQLRVMRLPNAGLLASVPLLEDDGSHTLGLFRICLPL